MFVSPDVAVRHVGQARGKDQEEQDRQARTMAALQHGFCRPGQEGSNVLRHKIHRRLGPIGVSNMTVPCQWRRHGSLKVAGTGLTLRPDRCYLTRTRLAILRLSLIVYCL